MKNYLLYLFVFFSFTNGFAQTDTVKAVKQKLFSLHFQFTTVSQYKPLMQSKYSGQNSLGAKSEFQTSVTATVFVGARLWKGAELFVNGEMAGGSGLSKTLGVGSFPNGETFRVGDPSPKIYLARVFFRQIIALDKQETMQDDEANSVRMKIPKTYLRFTVGKISIADYFDNNTYSHDPRTQFLSWGLMSNGAWDYPANTRGYTPSIVAEFFSPKNEFRLAYCLEPNTANGSDMNWNPVQAGSLTAEYKRNYSIKGLNGSISALGFFSRSRMGNYREAIAHPDSLGPNTDLVRRNGNIKYGFGINAEQQVTDFAGVFLRASINDGNNETWTFTEIDHSFSFGFSADGSKYKRNYDNVGIAMVVCGLSKPHRDYLGAGGYGFMLGDGKINYAPEALLEIYYAASFLKGKLTITPAYQLIVNPGYNKDRGPASVLSMRLHAEF